MTNKDIESAVLALRWLYWLACIPRLYFLLAVYAIGLAGGI